MGLLLVFDMRVNEGSLIGLFAFDFGCFGLVCEEP